MSYRDIIKVHTKEVIKKMSQTTVHQKDVYWEWVLEQLIADLVDYETDGQKRWKQW